VNHLSKDPSCELEYNDFEGAGRGQVGHSGFFSTLKIKNMQATVVPETTILFVFLIYIQRIWVEAFESLAGRNALENG
jgi:hypothetical protein